MASPAKPRVEGDKSKDDHYDEDENDDSDGDRSYYSDEGSYRSGSAGSYRSGEDSYRSGEGSYRSGEGSYRSGERSYRSDERSRSGEGSYRSREGSYRSRSNRSGYDSRRSAEGSYYSGEGSSRSGPRSFRSGEGSYSYRSRDRSYRSGEGSHRSDRGSYRSDEGSYRSGQGSYRSGEGSYRSGERSFRSGEGSYRSGERSYRSGEGSYRSGDLSHRSGEGSYRSGSYRSGEFSRRSGDRSYRSRDGSHRSGDRSYRSGEGSRGSGDGSYRSRSRRSGSRSFRSGQGSNQPGDDSYRSGSRRSYRDDDDYSQGSDRGKHPPVEHPDEEGSFHSSEESSFGEDGYDDRGKHPPDKDPDQEGSCYSSEEASFGEEGYDDRGKDPPHMNPGQEGSFRSSEEASFGEEDFIEPTDDASQDFGREVTDDEEGPTAPFQNSKKSMGTESEFDSEAPSFAEEVDFSPFPTSTPRKASAQIPVVFENGGFADENFGQPPISEESEEASREGSSGQPHDKGEGEETAIENDISDDDSFGAVGTRDDIDDGEPSTIGPSADSAIPLSPEQDSFGKLDEGNQKPTENGDEPRIHAFGKGAFSGEAEGENFAFDDPARSSEGDSVASTSNGEMSQKGADADAFGSGAFASSPHGSDAEGGSTTSSRSERDDSSKSHSSRAESDLEETDVAGRDGRSANLSGEELNAQGGTAGDDSHDEEKRDTSFGSGTFGKETFSEGVDFSNAGEGDDQPSEGAFGGAAFETDFNAPKADDTGAFATDAFGGDPFGDTKPAGSEDADANGFGGFPSGEGFSTGFEEPGATGGVPSSADGEEPNDLEAFEGAGAFGEFGSQPFTQGGSDHSSVLSGTNDVPSLQEESGASSNASSDHMSPVEGEKRSEHSHSSRSSKISYRSSVGSSVPPPEGDEEFGGEVDEFGAPSVGAEDHGFVADSEAVLEKNGGKVEEDRDLSDRSRSSAVASVEGSHRSKSPFPDDKEGSYRSGERSQFSHSEASEGRSSFSAHGSGQGSYSDEHSCRSGEDSYHSEKRLDASPADSYRSREDSTGSRDTGNEDGMPQSSEGSFTPGEGEENTATSYRSGDELRSVDNSRKTPDDSYRSGEDSCRSGEGSYHSRSVRSGERSYRSDDKSYRSDQDSHRSTAHSNKSGQDSYRSRDEGSYQSGERSFRSGEGSYHSRSGSGRSAAHSYHSGDESYRSGSYRSGEKSYHSENGSVEEPARGDGSYRSEGGSYRSGEGSFASGRGSHQSRKGSYQSEQRSRSGREESFRSDGGSHRSGSYDDDGSFRSGERSGSYRSGEKSYHSENGSVEEPARGDGSYRSEGGSYRSGEGSFASGRGSHQSGKGSSQSEQRSRSGREESFRSDGGSHRSGSYDDDGSFPSGERSHATGEDSRDAERSFQSKSYSSRGESPLSDSKSRLLQASQHSRSHSDRSGGSMEKDDASDKAEETSDREEGQPEGNDLVASSADHDSDASQGSEQSMKIGEVFGQPDELFEDTADAERSKPSEAETEDDRRQSSQKSELSQDDTISQNEGSKVSAPKDEGERDGREPVDEAPPLQTSKAEVDGDDDESIQLSEIMPQLKKTPNDPPPEQSKRKGKESEGDAEERRKRKKKKKKRRKEAKSPELLDLVANVNDAMLVLEEKGGDMSDENDNNDTSAHRLLHGFDALLAVFLQLSDELELISTFAKAKKKKDKEAMAPVQALKAVLSFAGTLDQLFADLKPIILDCFEEEPDDDMDDMLYRLNSLVDLLCETTHRVGERQEWNERAETTYVTLLELMEREALELRCYFEDVETPEEGLSANIHEAWSATGHIEELQVLRDVPDDPDLFRQICYEVMVSTDQWCPDTTILMEICLIDPSMLEEEPDPEYLDEEDLAPIPQIAEHVLDKVNGDPLPRTVTLASILRRVLPPRAVTDSTLLDHFTSVRNTIRNPLGLSATNIVSISSVPEQLDDAEALGVGGMGKTTLAAMVAEHPDVRRYFIDGVVWVYIGGKELNYNRYTQCLRELVAQLDFYDGVPLFAELLHTPGETLSKRYRREEGFMIYARDTIAELLHDRSVLIILDDVCFEPDLDWFDFAPMPGESTDNLDSNCALLVTTRCRTLLPAADTVEVDMLDEADAISLLIQESGQLSHTLMAESREARSVVRECANHPLAVKSVGRWLNLKHATAGVVSSVEEIHAEVIKSMDKILKSGDHTGTDMMYEILSMSLAPAINGERTSIIKFCLAAFVIVFCQKDYISDFALTEPTPIIPMAMAELLFETLLEMNESSLLQKGSLFYAQKKEAAVLIPEALSALGVLKVITYSDAEEDEVAEDEQKFLQVMHFIHHEYGEYLCSEDEALKDLTKDAERQWNRALVEAYLSRVEEWDIDLEDAGHSYALEMIVSHMIRGGMYSAAADLLADRSFVRGRLLSLGRENSTRRHIKDCENLCKKLKERRAKGTKLEPRNVMKAAYQALGSQLTTEDEEQSMEDPRIKDVEVARAHYEIGFSLAEQRCWDAAIAHWETSQEMLESSLGTVEVVAGILFNIGVVYAEMNEYEQALDSLKQCLRIRGTIHGEEHILYSQTIQKIGDIFLSMSDYHEAMESYNWALDVMYLEPDHHRVEIGEILDNKGTIHYSKGEIDEALESHQEALRSKQVDLGEDHPELAPTYHHIGNCLSDKGSVEDAMAHFEEAIRLKEIDPEGGPERDADVLTIEGILHNLEGNQEQGLECYEKSLQILVTKVPHRKEKVASLLHLIGCVYLMSGEQKKAMKLFEESLQARRKVLGFVHLDVASTLFNMAFLHQTRNRLDKALKCLEEALKIRQLRLPDSEKVAVTHEKIGSLARAIGKTKKAEINFEDALRIRRKIHGEQHEAVANVLQELGDLMDESGDNKTAMSYYIEALDIRRNCLGMDDIAVAETLYSMGYTLHNNDEADRALVCFEEALSIRQYRLGEDSKEVGDTLNMMGFLKAKRGELEDALTLLWDALRIRKLQDDHIKVSETLKNIGNVHREKEERELAVECYEECLRIRRDDLGPDHEKVADALIAMGNVQSDMDNTDDAMRSYQEALRIRTRVFGEHDESVAAVLQYMGTMEFSNHNYDKARDLLTEFIRIRRDNQNRSDGDYVNVLFMVGNIHKMKGQEEDAQLCWQEAYQVFQALGLAETNPQIAKVMGHLLKLKVEEEEADQKKKGGGMFENWTEKFKSNAKEPKRRVKKSKGGGIQL